MSDVFRLIQISDCHVSADPGASYRGINPRQAFEKLLDHVIDWNPDALLVTGDLAEDGSEEAYRYLAMLLKDLEVPVLTVPGNHDLCLRQKKYFPMTTIEKCERTTGKPPNQYPTPTTRLTHKVAANALIAINVRYPILATPATK